MTNESNLSLEEVRARRKKLADEDKVLADIERGLEALARLWSDYQRGVVQNLVSPDQVAPSLISSTAAPRRSKTKNQLIVEALHTPRPLWQTAKEIQRFMSAESGRQVPMSSVSPALTALKKSGTLVRKDLSVALALRVESEEPSYLAVNGEAEASPDADQGSDPDQISQPSHGGA